MNGTISDSQRANTIDTIAGRPVAVVRFAVPQPGKQPPRGPNRWPLIAAGFGGLLLVALGVWVIIRDKDGKEVSRHQVPEGGSAGLVNDPPPLPNSKPVVPIKPKDPGPSNDTNSAAGDSVVFRPTRASGCRMGRPLRRECGAGGQF